MSHELVVVVSGGELPPSASARDVPRGVPVIAADGGLDARPVPSGSR